MSSNVSYPFERKKTGRGAVDGDGKPPHDGGMEARVARLEAGMEHVVRELVDIRQDIRGLRGELHSTTKWLLAAYGAGFIILLGAMAHGFHWL